MSLEILASPPQSIKNELLESVVINKDLFSDPQLTIHMCPEDAHPEHICSISGQIFINNSIGGITERYNWNTQTIYEVELQLPLNGARIDDQQSLSELLHKAKEYLCAHYGHNEHINRYIIKLIGKEGHSPKSFKFKKTELNEYCKKESSYDSITSIPQSNIPNQSLSGISSTAIGLSILLACGALCYGISRMWSSK